MLLRQTVLTRVINMETLLKMNMVQLLNFSPKCEDN